MSSETLHDKVRERLASDPMLAWYHEEYTPHVTDIRGKVRKWRFDFAWVSAKVALEVQGGTGGGAGYMQHTSGQEYERYNTFTASGWRVLQIGNRDMRYDGGESVFATVRMLLERETLPESGEPAPGALLGRVELFRGAPYAARVSWVGADSGTVLGEIDEVIPWAIRYLALRAAQQGATDSQGTSQDQD